jgi:hypothetical protein
MKYGKLHRGFKTIYVLQTLLGSVLEFHKGLNCWYSFKLLSFCEYHMLQIELRKMLFSPFCKLASD